MVDWSCLNLATWCLEYFLLREFYNTVSSTIYFREWCNDWNGKTPSARSTLQSMDRRAQLSSSTIIHRTFGISPIRRVWIILYNKHHVSENAIMIERLILTHNYFSLSHIFICCQGVVFAARFGCFRRLWKYNSSFRRIWKGCVCGNSSMEVSI